jgi:hypothetical protein
VTTADWTSYYTPAAPTYPEPSFIASSSAPAQQAFQDVGGSTGIADIFRSTLQLPREILAQQNTAMGNWFSGFDPQVAEDLKSQGYMLDPFTGKLVGWNGILGARPSGLTDEDIYAGIQKLYEGRANQALVAQPSPIDQTWYPFDEQQQAAALPDAGAGQFGNQNLNAASQAIIQNPEMQQSDVRFDYTTDPANRPDTPFSQATQAGGEWFADKYGTRIPVVSDIMRDYVKPGVAGVVGAPFNAAGAGLDIAGLESAAGISRDIGDVAGSVVSAFVPETAGDFATELLPVVGVGGDIARATSRGVGNAGAAAARNLDSLTRAAVTPEPSVLRVAVREGAVVPDASGGLGASRGAVNVSDPSGVRILGPDEAPLPGEVEMFHGTAGPMRSGQLEPGTFLTPNPQDAASFARSAAVMARQPAGPLYPARRFLVDESGMVRIPGEPDLEAARYWANLSKPAARAVPAPVEAAPMSNVADLQSQLRSDLGLAPSRTPAEPSIGAGVPPNEPPTGLTGGRMEFPGGGGEQAGMLPGAKPGIGQRIVRNIADIPAMWKATQASGDVAGGSIRQGIASWFNEPSAAWTGLRKGVTAYASDPKNFDLDKHLDDLPYYNGGVISYGPEGQFIDTAGRAVAKGEKSLALRPMNEVMGGKDWATPGFEKFRRSPTLAAKIARKFPLAVRSEQSLRTIMVADATVKRGKYVSDAAKFYGDGFRQDWVKFYEDIARVSVGAGDVPNWARGLSNNFYSLQNLVARWQTLTKPFTSPGAPFRAPWDMPRHRGTTGIFSPSPRGVASRNLVRFAAGEMANLRLLSAAGKSTGLFEVGYNPLEPGFGRLQFDDEDGNTYSVDLMGGYAPMVKLMAHGADAVTNPESEYDLAGELLQFFRNKQAPASAAIADTIVENTGLKNDPMYQSPFSINWADPKTYTSGKIVEKIAPFWAGESAQALISGSLNVNDPDDLAESAGLMMSQLAGAPVSLYPPSVTEEKRTFSGTYTNAAGETVPYPIERGSLKELKQADPLAEEAYRKANSELQKELDERRTGTSKDIDVLKEQGLSQQGVLDAGLEAGTLSPAQWREQSSDQRQSIAAQIRERAQDYKGDFPEDESDLGIALEAQANAIEGATLPTGAIDWDKVDREIAKLTPEQQQKLVSHGLVGETDTYRDYMRDLKKLEPYFEVRDVEWEKLAAKNQRFAGSANQDAWRQAEIQRRMTSGQSQMIAEEIADSILSVFAEELSMKTEAYLLRNKELIGLMNKWGYQMPDWLKELDPAYRTGSR